MTFWTPDSPNTVFHAENLTVLPQLPDGAFTVVYLDPPFNTGRTQTRLSTTAVRVAPAASPRDPTPPAASHEPSHAAGVRGDRPRPSGVISGFKV